MITVAPNSGCSAISKISDDIKAHPNPLNRASAGFLKGAVELVSGLAEGGVNLTQVGLEELEVFGDMLQGNKPSQWKMADISGMLETEKQLARLALGTVTSNVFFDASIVLDGLPQRGNVGSIQKELRLDRQMSENFWQETSKSIAEAFKEDPAQATGCAVFEVGLLLFPWAKSGKLGETTKGAEMLNDVDKLSDGANLLQRLSKSTGFGDDLTAANQLKTFNQGLKEFSQAAKASLSKEALEDLGENLRNLTFQVPSQEFALESAGTTGKIKGIGEFLDEAKLNVQRFATSSGDDVAKVGGKLDEVKSLKDVSEEIAQATFNKFDELASQEVGWNTPENQQLFKETFDKYAERAVQEGAVPSKEAFYNMYTMREYAYPEIYEEIIKQPYLKSGASSVVGGNSVEAAFKIYGSIGRGASGNFTTSIAEDQNLIFSSEGLKSYEDVAKIKGVNSSMYKSGIYQYNYSSELVKNFEKEGLIGFPNGDTPGASSLNIPGSKTWAGENIELSESELMMPTIDVSNYNYKDVIDAIREQGYFEIQNPTVVTNSGKKVIIQGIFKVNHLGG